MFRRRLLLSFAILAIFSGVAVSDLIGTVDVSPGFFLQAENVTCLHIGFGHLTSQGRMALIESLVWELTESDAGSSFIVDFDSHASFGEFASYITDGVNQTFGLEFGNCGEAPIGLCSLGTEVRELVHPGSGVDLTGYDIDYLEMTLNGLELEPGVIHWPHAAPEVVTTFALDLTFNIYGHPIPEPATLLMFGLGGLVLRKRRS